MRLRRTLNHKNCKHYEICIECLIRAAYAVYLRARRRVTVRSILVTGLTDTDTVSSLSLPHWWLVTGDWWLVSSTRVAGAVTAVCRLYAHRSRCIPPYTAQRTPPTQTQAVIASPAPAHVPVLRQYDCPGAQKLDSYWSIDSTTRKLRGSVEEEAHSTSWPLNWGCWTMQMQLPADGESYDFTLLHYFGVS